MKRLIKQSPVSLGAAVLAALMLAGMAEKVAYADVVKAKNEPNMPLAQDLVEGGIYQLVNSGGCQLYYCIANTSRLAFIDPSRSSLRPIGPQLPVTNSGVGSSTDTAYNWWLVRAPDGEISNRTTGGVWKLVHMDTGMVISRDDESVIGAIDDNQWVAGSRFTPQSYETQWLLTHPIDDPSKYSLLNNAVIHESPLEELTILDRLLIGIALKRDERKHVDTWTKYYLNRNYNAQFNGVNPQLAATTINRKTGELARWTLQRVSGARTYAAPSSQLINGAYYRITNLRDGNAVQLTSTISNSLQTSLPNVSDTQLWQLQEISDTKWVMINRNTGKAITASASGQGLTATQYGIDIGNQQWTFTKLSGGYRVSIGATNGDANTRVLTSGGITVDSPMTTSSTFGGENSYSSQMWNIERVAPIQESFIAKIINLSNNLALVNPSGGAPNVAAYAVLNSQEWNFEHANASSCGVIDCYYIRSNNGQGYLQMPADPGSSAPTKAPTKIDDANASTPNCQQWKVAANSDGSIKLVGACQNKALGLSTSCTGMPQVCTTALQVSALDSTDQTQNWYVHYPAATTNAQRTLVTASTASAMSRQVVIPANTVKISGSDLNAVDIYPGTVLSAVYAQWESCANAIRFNVNGGLTDTDWSKLLNSIAYFAMGGISSPVATDASKNADMLNTFNQIKDTQCKIAKPNLVDGVFYRLASAADDQYVADLKDNGINNDKEAVDGKNIRAAKQTTGRSGQWWRISSVLSADGTPKTDAYGNPVWRITNWMVNKAFDTGLAGSLNGTETVVAQDVSTAISRTRQEWVITMQADGTYVFKLLDCGGSGYPGQDCYLDPAKKGTLNNDGAYSLPFLLTTSTSGDLRWKLKRVTPFANNTTIKLINRNSENDQLLTKHDASAFVTDSAVWTDLEIAGTSTATDVQKWKFIAANDCGDGIVDCYIVWTNQSGVTNLELAATANNGVATTAPAQSTTHRWQLITRDDGTVRLRNISSGKFLTAGLLASSPIATLDSNGNASVLTFPLDGTAGTLEDERPNDVSQDTSLQEWLVKYPIDISSTTSPSYTPGDNARAFKNLGGLKPLVDKCPSVLPVTGICADVSNLNMPKW